MVGAVRRRGDQPSAGKVAGAWNRRIASGFNATGRRAGRLRLHRRGVAWVGGRVPRPYVGRRGAGSARSTL